MKTDGSEEKKCNDVLSSATSMKMFYHSCQLHRRNWCHAGLLKASHAISTINECLSVRQDADEVGGQTCTLNMQIQANSGRYKPSFTRW